MNTVSVTEERRTGAHDVSVVTINYNDSAGLRATLDSVLAQRDLRVESIVVDGGSTDGSVDLLAELGDRIDWSSEPDDGRYHAMNIGARRASGRFIWFMHAGDRFATPWSASAGVTALASAGATWGYGLSRVRTDTGSLVGVTGAVPFNRAKFALGTNPIPHQAALFDLGFFRALGDYEPEFGIAADQLHFARAVRQCPPVVIPEILCDFDAHGAGSTRGVMPHFRDMTRARRAAGLHITGSPRFDAVLGTGLGVAGKAKQTAAHLLGMGGYESVRRGSAADLVVEPHVLVDHARR